jgi:uncharacterized lipoprotein YmbA
MFLGRAGQVAALAALWLCAGCVELGGRTPPSRFYLLAPLAPAREAPGEVGLGLGRVRLPGYLDRPQIVTRDGEHRLEVATLDRWAEPLDESVARVTAANLARLLGTGRVQRHPWRDPQAVELSVDLDLLRFDGSRGGSVRLEAVYRLRGPGGILERSTAIEEPSDGRGYTELAAAMSRALASLAREIADAAATLGPPGP